MILPASYSNGFAPRDGQPLYPELWNGCVGAWAPSLGASGGRLFDWAASKNHGTLTNMDLSARWGMIAGKRGLNFDGTDDYVSISNLTSMPTWSCCCWVYMPSAGLSVYAGIVFFKEGSNAGNGITAVNGNIGCIRADSLVANSHYPNPTNRWAHVVATWDGTTRRIYVDGNIGTTGVADSGYGVTDSRFGRGFQAFNGWVDDVRIYNRVLSFNKIKLLGSRAGIAYDMAPRRRSSVQVAASFNRRRRLLVGAGS